MINVSFVCDKVLLHYIQRVLWMGRKGIEMRNGLIIMIPTTMKYPVTHCSHT